MFYISQDWTEILKNEAIKKAIEKLVGAVANSGGQEALVTVLQKVDWKTLLWAELGVLFFMIVLRSYVFTKCKSFWSHFIGEIWTLAVYFSLSLFFAPLIVFGVKYLDVLKTVLQYFF